jgi:hypothetical protein
VVVVVATVVAVVAAKSKAGFSNFTISATVGKPVIIAQASE